MILKKTSSKEISELRNRLVEYVEQTNKNFDTVHDELNEIETKIAEMSKTFADIKKTTNVDKLNKIEKKIAKMSKTFADIKKTTNVDKLNKIETKIAEMSEVLNILSSLLSGLIDN